MKDLDTLFDTLGRSAFRSRFALSRKEKAYLKTKGLAMIMEHGAMFIRDRLAPARPKNDGKQTPMRNHPVFVAQHATATCCRKCLAKWHDIEPGQELTQEQINYVLLVIQKWIEQQMQP